MIEILFSKAALCYYGVGILSGYHQKISKQLRGFFKQRADLYTILFNIATVCGTIFLVWYSYKTKWWAFIPLIVLNILTYVIVDVLIGRLGAQSAEEVTGNLAYKGRYITPLLIILMLYFTYTL